MAIVTARLLPMSRPYRHPVFARVYTWLSQHAEAQVGPYRDDLLAGLSGRVIEVGAGNGLNFAHYPSGVEHVLAVEPEPHLRRVAERKARQAPVAVDVVEGFADNLAAADGAFDAAVCSLVLCSVPDQDVALAEIRRVLRAGGQLRFFEHVRADTPALARFQRLADATIWPLLAGGCHAARDTASTIGQAGLVIERIERIRLPESGLQTPVSPAILGLATKP
jgi:ubiquinone/menaquinone biosynthesis C-methylase UbiE